MDHVRVTLIISTIILFICVVLVAFKEKESFSSNKPFLYYRIADSLDQSQSSLLAIAPFTIYPDDLIKTDNFNAADMIMFETLNFIDTLIQKLKYPNKVKFIFGLSGTDTIASKSLLAISLKTHYDEKTVNTLIPKTYILENGLDGDQFKNDIKVSQLKEEQKKIYIIKKNIQRQEGFLITRDINVILNAFKPTSDYVVCQELLQNPLLVNRRKINLRVYLLIVISPSQTKPVKMYIYNDGFMYYTPKPFKLGSTDPDENITTGYIDRQVYIDNPLTIQDFLLIMNPAAANIIWNNIVNLFKQLAMAYQGTFASKNANLPGTKFLIFGCDVAPADDYSVKLMEVNKGPDLTYKDERDGNLKKSVVQETLQILGILQGNSKNFIQVL